jgi:hypothetical protein
VVGVVADGVAQAAAVVVDAEASDSGDSATCKEGACEGVLVWVPALPSAAWSLG